MKKFARLFAASVILSIFAGLGMSAPVAHAQINPTNILNAIDTFTSIVQNVGGAIGAIQGLSSGQGVYGAILGNSPSNNSQVPSVVWQTPLEFRLRNRNGNIQIQINLDAIIGAITNPGSFDWAGTFESLGEQFLDPSNFNIQDILSGDALAWGDIELPGVTIEGVDLFFDFYYHLQGEVYLNGKQYNNVQFYFGNDPNSLEYLIAEAPNPGSSVVLDTYVFNSRTNPEFEDGPGVVTVGGGPVQIPVGYFGNMSDYQRILLAPGQYYYVGVFGETADTIETIAIQRLPLYTWEFAQISTVYPNWRPPYMTSAGNGELFRLEGEVISVNRERADMTLRFGSTRNTFEPIMYFPITDGPAITFSRNVSGTYASLDDLQTYPIEKGTTYFAGIYEGPELVSFIPVGTTAAPTAPPTPNQPPTPTAPPSQPPFSIGGQTLAEIEANLESGLVPCDGVTVPCDYNKAIELVERIINFIIILIIPISAIAFVYAGALLLFSGASPDKRSKAKSVFLKVAIGIAIILAAWLIVKTILVSLGVDSGLLLLDLTS